MLAGTRPVGCNRRVTFSSCVRVFVLVIGSTLLTAASLRAQPFEAGAHVTMFDAALSDGRQWGGGARVGVQVAPWVVAEGEISRVSGDGTVTGAMTQLLGGVRIGARNERFGLFAKVRPGVARFADDFLAPGIACIAVFPPPESCLAERTSFALDLGSVVEVYPSRRTLLRVDLGSTHIWYRPRGDGDAERRGSFQVSIGAGMRF